eukprot:11558490-Heterocapsa_arctica.AAC.1
MEYIYKGKFDSHGQAWGKKPNWMPRLRQGGDREVGKGGKKARERERDGHRHRHRHRHGHRHRH